MRPPPETLAVEAEYGLTVLQGAGERAARLAGLLLSPDGRKTLTEFGFAPPDPPIEGKVSP